MWKSILKLWPLSSVIHQVPVTIPNAPSQLAFEHKHAFVAGVSLPKDGVLIASSNLHGERPPQILFNDVLLPLSEMEHSAKLEDPDNGDYTAAGISTAILRTKSQSIARPRLPRQYQHLHYLKQDVKPEWEWDILDAEVPDVTDRETLLELAKMTGDAYAMPGEKTWYDVDGRWNSSIPFGWDPSDDGLRGHLFVSSDNSTVVISIKGTSLFLSGPTTKKDKLNDNLLFSCCCAHVDYSWSWQTVCDCCGSSFKCGSKCIEQSLLDDELFYHVAVNLYNNVTYMYPSSQIWLAGHSLGGSLAALLGATFGVPTVAFEAPGERMAAKRLHLPFPPGSHPESGDLISADLSLHPITHIYNTADPIPQGQCTGIRSLCSKGGYVLETGCHLGKSIIYDTVTRFGWSQGIVHHRISDVIEKVMKNDWNEPDWDEDEGPVMRPVPRAKVEVDCVDCYKWSYSPDD